MNRIDEIVEKYLDEGIKDKHKYAYAEGVRCREEGGKDKTHCPYMPSSSMYTYWIKGFKGEPLNEGSEKDDYKKMLKVINSVQTKEHAEAANRMIENFRDWHGKDLGFEGRVGVSKKKMELQSMLNDVLKKRGIDYKVKISW